MAPRWRRHSRFWSNSASAISGSCRTGSSAGRDSLFSVRLRANRLAAASLARRRAALRSLRVSRSCCCISCRRWADSSSMTADTVRSITSSKDTSRSRGAALSSESAIGGSGSAGSGTGSGPDAQTGSSAGDAGSSAGGCSGAAGTAGAPVPNSARMSSSANSSDTGTPRISSAVSDKALFSSSSVYLLIVLALHPAAHRLI